MSQNPTKTILTEKEKKSMSIFQLIIKSVDAPAIEWIEVSAAKIEILEKFVYLAVEICHQKQLPSATPSFAIENKK